MFLKNSAGFAISMVIKGLLGFVIIAVFTRIMSVEEYGQYAFVMALVVLLDVFAFFWVRQALLRYIKPDKSDEDQSYIATAIALTLGVALAVLVPSFVMGAFWTGGKIIGIIGFLAVLEAFFALVYLFARIRQKILLFAVFNVARPSIALFAGAFLIYSGWASSGALAGVGLSLLICAFLGALFLNDLRGADLRHISKDIAAQIFKFGAPLVLLFSIQSAIKSTDRILIEAFLGSAQTGLYAAAQDIPMKILALFTLAVHMAGYPLVIQHVDKGDDAAAVKQLEMNLIVLCGLGLPICAGIAMCAPGFAALFLGADFRGFAVQSFGFFAAAAFINCVVQYYIVLPFHMREKTKAMIWPFAAAFLCNALIGIIFIPQYGAMSAIAASVAAYICLATAVFLKGRGLFALPFPAKPICAIVFAVVVMSGVLYFLPFDHRILGTTLRVVIGAGVYSFVLGALYARHLPAIWAGAKQALR